MKAYIPNYPAHAGHWIYKGYQLAWAKLGYDVITNVSRWSDARRRGNRLCAHHQ